MVVRTLSGGISSSRVRIPLWKLPPPPPPPPHTHTNKHTTHTHVAYWSDTDKGEVETINDKLRYMLQKRRFVKIIERVRWRGRVGGGGGGGGTEWVGVVEKQWGNAVKQKMHKTVVQTKCCKTQNVYQLLLLLLLFFTGPNSMKQKVYKTCSQSAAKQKVYRTFARDKTLQSRKCTRPLPQTKCHRAESMADMVPQSWNCTRLWHIQSAGKQSLWECYCCFSFCFVSLICFLLFV